VSKAAFDRQLNVFYEDILVGRLNQSDDLVYSFVYADSWLDHPNRFPLSLAMPLQKEPFGNRLTLSFFENLLPEGEVRAALEKSHHVKGPFEFLKEFGKDCAGAIIVTADPASPYIREKQSEVKINIEKIYEAIDQRRSVAEVIAETNPGYLSIAGAQDKFSAIFKNDLFFLPTHGKPTTHIVKVPIYRAGVKESVYNEFYCMRLAQAIGLPTPRCTVINDSAHPLYIVERYDRFHDSNYMVHRLHQQDFCQAQGTVGEYKYEAQGGPSFTDNYNLIKKHVTIKERPRALFSYLEWVCFNLLIGNNDCHSKNLSLLLINNRIHLAPFYDLLCTSIYPKLERRFSFMLGDRDDASRIGKNQFKMVDASLGLKSGTMANTMWEVKDRLLNHKDRLAEELLTQFPKVKIIERISELIANRCKSLERQGI